MSDLTLDDGEMTHPPLVQPGQALQKGWRLLNSGTTTWAADYRLEYADGNTSVSDMGGQPVAVGRAVAPGETADFYVNLVAPLAPYTYQGFWEMKNSAGVPFGQQVYVAVTVAGAPTPVPPPTATPAPGIWFGADRDQIAAGECTTVRWDVTNAPARE